MCQILRVFTTKFNEDEEGAMDIICRENRRAGSSTIIFRQLFLLSKLEFNNLNMLETNGIARNFQFFWDI